MKEDLQKNFSTSMKRPVESGDDGLGTNVLDNYSQNAEVLGNDVLSGDVLSTNKEANHMVSIIGFKDFLNQSNHS